MSYRIKVLKDSPIGYWPLDESSGTSAIDNSGCGNNGTYNGISFAKLMPLVCGGVRGTKITNSSSISFNITKNYYESTVSGGGFANLKTSDNDFSLEVWFAPSIVTANRTTIFADATNSIGIYYENNNILFKLNSEELYYNVNSQDKVFHVVATYSRGTMQIFIDGAMAAIKNLSSFRFSNTSTGTFTIGPTSNSSDSFLVDAPAIYRYCLSSNKVMSHYSSGVYHVNAYQIVNQDNGFFFSTHEENLKPSYIYEYSEDKVKASLTSDTYYDENGGYVGFYESTGEKSLVIFDSIFLPSALQIVSSKIQWRSDKNITVEMGTDGTTYPYLLTNHSYLPLYNKGEPIGDRLIYLKITFNTKDATKYFPKFLNLSIKFYSTKDLYSDNSKYYITSDQEYNIASFSYPVLLRMSNDGIQTSSTGGFKINCDENINSIEFFYKPSSTSASTLINNSSANLSWNSSGVLSKTNISTIYVNGEDLSSATNVSSMFSAGEIYHVIIKFSSSITGDIKFNYNVTGGPSNRFNNIALYKKSLTTQDILRHYSDYISRPTLSSSDSAMTLTESGINYANTEWVVLSTI